MALGANTSKWYFVGDSSSLERSAKRSEDALDRLNRTGKGAFGGLASSAGALTGLLGVGGLAYGIKSLTDAAKESELAAARMRTQFDALGLSFETHRQHVDDVIQAQSRLAALDDEELSDSFTTILRVTGDVNRSLELNALAADIARGRQIDLASAGEIVAKVAGGNVGILSRYGIAIEKGASATEALGELQRLFAGQAEAYGSSNAGAADRAAVAWENAREALGERLLPVLATVATYLADDIIPAVTEFASSVDSLVDKLGGWKVAAGFILSGLLASRILGIVSALKTIPAAAATAAAASTGAAGLGGLASFMRFALPAAAAAGALAMRAQFSEKGPLGDVGNWVRENVFGEIKDYAPDDGRLAAYRFKEAFKKDLKNVDRGGGDFGFEGPAAVLEQAGEDAGEDTAKAFSLSLTSFLRVKFPTMANAALAPTWDDIAKAAEAAGMDVGSAFTSGFQQTAGVTNGQFGRTTLTNYATATGAQGAAVANAVNYAISQQGVDYAWGGGHGGTGPSAGSDFDAGEYGFDCSGLVFSAYAKQGIKVPGTTTAWKGWPYVVRSVNDLQPGDVIITNNWKHMVMYIGDGKVVAASGPDGNTADAVVIQPLSMHVGGIVAMYRPVVGAQVSAGVIDTVASQAVDAPDRSPGVPGTTSPTTSTAPEPRARTSFPSVAGISDRVQQQFEDANQEGPRLRFNESTGKYELVDRKPDAKAMKKVADRIRTKLLPPLRRRIKAVRKTLRNPKLSKVDRESAKNLLAALLQEEQELQDLWGTIIEAIRELAPDEAVETTAAYDYSGPVGGQPGLPGHDDPATTDSPAADTSPDLRAELDQANRRAAASARAAQLSGSFVSSLGIGVDANGNATVTGGGVTVNMSMAFPPSPEQAVRIGQAVAQSMSGQGFQPSTAELLGV